MTNDLCKEIIGFSEEKELIKYINDKTKRGATTFKVFLFMQDDRLNSYRKNIKTNKSDPNKKKSPKIFKNLKSNTFSTDKNINSSNIVAINILLLLILVT